MTTGTKSILIGAHCFFLHPLFVLAAYWKLYGFTLDPRIIMACIVHDLGYIGKKQMDDDEGETHPLLGAKIMGYLFDNRDWLGAPTDNPSRISKIIGPILYFFFGSVASTGSYTWYDFSLLHSRHYSKRLNKSFSRLCVADKYAICLTPVWLYDPLVNLTGEVKQYMQTAKDNIVLNENSSYGHKLMKRGALAGDSKVWYRGLQYYMLNWVSKNVDKPR
jgi:hypothetical protein